MEIERKRVDHRNPGIKFSKKIKIGKNNEFGSIIHQNLISHQINHIGSSY